MNHIMKTGKKEETLKTKLDPLNDLFYHISIFLSLSNSLSIYLFKLIVFPDKINLYLFAYKENHINYVCREGRKGHSSSFELKGSYFCCYASFFSYFLPINVGINDKNPKPNNVKKPFGLTPILSIYFKVNPV